MEVSPFSGTVSVLVSCYGCLNGRYTQRFWGYWVGEDHLGDAGIHRIPDHDDFFTVSAQSATLQSQNAASGQQSWSTHEERLHLPVMDPH